MDKCRPTYNHKHNCTCVIFYISSITKVWTTDNKEIKEKYNSKTLAWMSLFLTHIYKIN